MGNWSFIRNSSNNLPVTDNPMWSVKRSVLHPKTHLAITASEISYWGDLSNTAPYFSNKYHTVRAVVANRHHRALKHKIRAYQCTLSRSITCKTSQTMQKMFWAKSQRGICKIVCLLYKKLKKKLKGDVFLLLGLNYGMMPVYIFNNNFLLVFKKWLAMKFLRGTCVNDFYLLLFLA